MELRNVREFGLVIRAGSPGPGRDSVQDRAIFARDKFKLADLAFVVLFVSIVVLWLSS